MTDHMPGCAALRCQNSSPGKGGGKWGVKCGLDLASRFHKGYFFTHEFIPGSCNCELGRLRAEVEKLDARVQQWMQIAGELDDWQRRAVKIIQLYACPDVMTEKDDKETGKLIAEAGQTEVDK